MILVLVPVIFELCFVTLLAVLLSSAEREYDDLQHYRGVLLLLRGGAEASMKAALILTAGSSVSMDAKAAQLEVIEQQAKDSHFFIGPEAQKFPELQSLVDQDKAIRADALTQVARMKKAFGNTTLPDLERRIEFEKFKHKNKEVFLQTLFEAAPMSKRILEAETKVLSAEPKEMSHLQTQLAVSVIAGLCISIIISLGLAKLFVQDIVLRLRQAAQNAELIANWKTLPAKQEGSDEIAGFDRILHESSTMLSYAREKERAILNNAASIICSLDGSLQFVEVNATASRYWQYTSDELLNSSLVSILHSDTINDTTAQLEEISRGAGRGEIENVIRCKSGTLMNCHWHVNWLPSRRRLYCVVNDVTELRAIERLKQYFISIVSHDLRGPLMSVGLNLALISEGKLGTVSENTLSEIRKSEKSLHRLMHLVNDLLELESFGVNKTKLEMSALSAADVCNDAKEAVETQVLESSVRISGPVGDAAIIGDSKRLAQVVIKLLLLAIESSPPGSRIDLSIRAENQMVEIRVTDQGAGISAHDLSSIFDKFHRDKSLGKSSQQQSGLGLAIVKEIVTAHGGLYGVESKLGVGTTFWIRIPELFDPLEDEH